MRLIIKSSFVVLALSMFMVGCSNKINQTGAWLVSSDTALVPVYYNSIADSAKVTSTQVNTGLATGTSSELLLGKVPWTEADLLIRFSALDPVDSAQTILSTTVTLYRSSYLLEAAGENYSSAMFAGYSMDTVWNSTTVTWDSVSALGYGTQNIITSSAVTDSTVTLNLDSSIVRQWAIATQDTTVPNNGFIIKPLNDQGIVSVYGPVWGVTGQIPICTVIYIKDNTLDTTVVSLSYATSVAQTSIESAAPQGPYAYVQGGTGEQANITFDLSHVPNYSIVNQAILTLRMDSTAQLPYTRVSADTLTAYYTISAASNQVNSNYPVLGYPVGNVYTFNVTSIVQYMVDSQNNGFMIVQSNEMNSADLVFLYNGNAPDSLKPKLTITYTPTKKR